MAGSLVDESLFQNWGFISRSDLSKDLSAENMSSPWFGHFTKDSQHISSVNQQYDHTLVLECYPNEDAVKYRVENIPLPERTGRADVYEKVYETELKIKNCIYIFSSRAYGSRYIHSSLSGKQY